MTSESSSGSRGTSSTCSCSASSALLRPRASRPRRANAASSAASSRAASRSSPACSPVAVGRDDRAQLGVAAARALRAARLVGVDVRVGEPPLEVGVLGDAAPRRTRTSRRRRRTAVAVDGGHERPSGGDDQRAAPGARPRRQCRRRRGGAVGGADCGVGLLAEALLELGDAAAGVEDLLLARVERVAGAADLGVDDAVLRGAARGERVAAGAV